MAIYSEKKIYVNLLKASFALLIMGCSSNKTLDPSSTDPVPRIGQDTNCDSFAAKNLKEHGYSDFLLNRCITNFDFNQTRSIYIAPDQKTYIAGKGLVEISADFSSLKAYGMAQGLRSESTNVVFGDEQTTDVYVSSNHSVDGVHLQLLTPSLDTFSEVELTLPEGMDKTGVYFTDSAVDPSGRLYLASNKGLFVRTDRRLFTLLEATVDSNIGEVSVSGIGDIIIRHSKSGDKYQTSSDSGASFSELRTPTQYYGPPPNLTDIPMENILLIGSSSMPGALIWSLDRGTTLWQHRSGLSGISLSSARLRSDGSILMLTNFGLYKSDSLLAPKTLLQSASWNARTLSISNNGRFIFVIGSELFVGDNNEVQNTKLGIDLSNVIHAPIDDSLSLLIGSNNVFLIENGVKSLTTVYQSDNRTNGYALDTKRSLLYLLSGVSIVQLNLKTGERVENTFPGLSTEANLKSRATVDSLGRLWIPTNSGLIFSDDGGKNLVTLTSSDGLPSNRCKFVVYDDSTNRVFVGTVEGLAYTSDGGATFNTLTDDDLSSNDVTTLTIQNNKIFTVLNRAKVYEVNMETSQLEVALYPTDSMLPIVDIFFNGDEAYVIADDELFRNDGSSVWENLSDSSKGFYNVSVISPGPISHQITIGFEQGSPTLYQGQ